MKRRWRRRGYWREFDGEGSDKRSGRSIGRITERVSLKTQPIAIAVSSFFSIGRCFYDEILKKIDITNMKFTRNGGFRDTLKV